MSRIIEWVPNDRRRHVKLIVHLPGVVAEKQGRACP